MDDAFRSFILALGMLFGLVEGGKDPALAARLYRDADQVILSAEVADFVSPSMRKLVDSGNAVSLNLSVEREGRTILLVKRSLRRLADPPRFLVSQSGSGERTLETESEEAAYILLGQFYGLRVDSVANLAASLGPGKQTLRILVRAAVSVEGATPDEAAVLWNYKQPSRVFSLRSMTEVPY
jgi:hypothetical protein